MNSTFRAYVALKEHLRNQSLPLPAQQLIALYSLAVEGEDVQITKELYDGWNWDMANDILPDNHPLWEEMCLNNKSDVFELINSDDVYLLRSIHIGHREWGELIQPAILNNDWAKACYNTMANVWDTSVPV